MHWRQPETANRWRWTRLGLACLLASALGACASLVTPDPGTSGPAAVEQPEWRSYARIEVAAPVPQVWHVVRLDLTRARLAVSPGDLGSGSEYQARTTSAALTATGAYIAVNGGFYAIPNLPNVTRGSVLDVMGTSIAGGTVFSSPQGGSRVVTSILCIGADVRVEDGQTCALPVTDALAAGPLLLRDGLPVSFEAQSSDFALNRHPRTAVGLSANGQIGWLVVVDGRQPASGGATLAELATFLRGLGADDAINLDGGGSSALVIEGADGEPSVVSSPIDGGVVGWERAVANHLLVFRPSEK
jgi:uncharacterized protein YigE (DUF2233 family)